MSCCIWVGYVGENWAVVQDIVVSCIMYVTINIQKCEMMAKSVPYHRSLFRFSEAKSDTPEIDHDSRPDLNMVNATLDRDRLNWSNIESKFIFKMLLKLIKSGKSNLEGCLE